ncbi:DUF4194 domain-containing protein [Poseidonibacter lekithochrous]|uniref:DUF4194 domain-containing protein n=1 Tax=Poseidonibacter lekithochrous TaxID=1904463 RepID=UPI0008FCB7CA|nr:DUF4194 domain-containing protein [Poseidonibacter lekithochrous]QKJ23294.1 DUF4194 domain-containing protein [Poseidonibacter lekithochrous]
MAINIYNSFIDLMEETGLNLEDFQAITSYLLENGVICREDTQKEEKYYDQFLRLESIIKDYLNLININVIHDEDLLSIRLYAPGSDFPDSFEDIDMKSNMSMSLTSEESAYLIALAILYNQKFNEGDVEDDASVEVELEEFNTALASYLSFTANENKSVRDDSLRTLRKLKVIKFAKGVFEDEDRPLIIRPYIKQVILPDMLKPFLENEEMIVTDDVVTEVQTEEDINEDK